MDKVKSSGSKNGACIQFEFLLAKLLFLTLMVYLPANDLLEDSPYESVNSRLSDIFRLAPIISGKSDVITSHLSA